MKFKFISAFVIAGIFISTFTVKTGVAQESYCGDGLTSSEFGEECDDGNFFNRDGCSSYCLLEDLTPPEITSVSIENGTEGVSTLTKSVTVKFNEPVDPASINKNTVHFKQYSTILNSELELLNNNTELIIRFDQGLLGDRGYSIVMQNFLDAPGNRYKDIFVSTFYTGEFTDIVAPNIIARPPTGLYNISQSVTLTPYVGENTFNEIYEDVGARVFFTIDGSRPSTASPLFDGALSIKSDTTLKYFGIDTKGNVSSINESIYKFDCTQKLNAKEVTPYPECQVISCGYGFVLKSNVCVIRLGGANDKDLENAVTAPMFGSDTPMTISTKPALYITPEHEGVLPRPINFIDLAGGTTIDFERDTRISYADGSPFTGYIKPPDNLYTKSFPTNFGYSFKSIFYFEPAVDETLYFEPMIKITVPFTERYDPGAKITIFTYDPITEEYYLHPKELFSVDEDAQTVSISSETTGTFFIAQPGESYNSIVFKDTVDHWAKNYIELLYRMGHVKGRSKGIFAPDDILTRAEFTKIALNAMGEEIDPFEQIEDSPFYDVPLYAWYVPYIQRAKDLGLIKGYPDGSFKPDSPINKVEALKLLLAGFRFDLGSAGQRIDNFEDVLTWEWYFPSVNFAIQNRLIDGIRLPNGKIQYDSFGPGRNMTRGEMAKLAVKAIELATEE